MKVVGILGSPTRPSRSAALLRAAMSAATSGGGGHGIEIHVADLPAQALVHAHMQDTVISMAISRVEQADLVLVATPIYKASYSGLLKSFLDLLPQDALRGKTVLPLATGGSPGHLLALDYALKPVLSALGARHTLDPVYAVDNQFVKDPVLGYRIDGAVVERIERALHALVGTHVPRPRLADAIAPPALAADVLQAPVEVLQARATQMLSPAQASC